MSNTNNNARNALNLNNEEMFMVDPRSDAEMGELYIDECDIEKARAVLEAALLESAEKELDEIPGHTSPRTFNGVDWDDMAYLIEVQLFMRKCMDRIEWINTRIEAAKAGDYLPREQFMALVAERKSLWTKWNKGKELSSDVVGNEKKMWGIFFNIDDREVFLKNHLEMDVSVWNTYGRDDEDDESFDRFHLDVCEMLRNSHLAEMAEHNRDVDVDWTYQDKRLAARLANEASLNEMIESCPW